MSTSTTGMPSPRVVLGVRTGPSNLCPVSGRSIFLLQLCVQVMTSPEDVLLRNRKSGARALRARNDAHNSIIRYSIFDTSVVNPRAPI